MTTARHHDPDGSVSAFLVERYLSPTAAENLVAAVPRAAELGRLRGESRAALGVQYLVSAYLPTEDICFCLVRARTADAVRALNDEADLPLDRITAAVLLYPTGAMTTATHADPTH
jgi:hypothetical protein